MYMGHVHQQDFIFFVDRYIHKLYVVYFLQSHGIMSSAFKDKNLFILKEFKTVSFW